MSEIKLLFLDIEWNQVEGGLNLDKDEILQIAGISFSENFNTKMKFSSYVKPQQIEDISWRTYKLLGLSEKLLLEAKPLEAVLDNFFNKFINYDAVVVWNRDAYNLFKYKSEALGFKMPKHRVVVLQEVLGDIIKGSSRKIGFKAALEMVGINFKLKLLHHAKHDVNCLYRLYHELYENYKAKCLEDNDMMCYSSTKSNMLHDSNCRYIKNISKNNLKHLSKQDVFLGASVCKCCVRKGGFSKLKLKKANNKTPKTIRAEVIIDDKYIYELCEKFKLDCHIGQGVIFIKTEVSRWRIFHDETSVISVFHENYKPKKSEHMNKRKKLNVGFHQQKVKSKSLYGVLNYIQRHDREIFLKKMLRKSSIDKLFEKLENERKLQRVLEEEREEMQFDLAQ